MCLSTMTKIVGEWRRFKKINNNNIPTLKFTWKVAGAKWFWLLGEALEVHVLQSTANLGRILIERTTTERITPFYKQTKRKPKESGPPLSNKEAMKYFPETVDRSKVTALAL